MNPFGSGLPRRILQGIRDLGGAHNDCLVASDPCRFCRSQVIAALELVYGDEVSSEEELAEAVRRDLENDRIEDQGPRG